MKGKKRVSRISCVLLSVAVALGLAGAVCAAGEGWLGVMLQPLTDEIAAAMNLEKGTAGVLVSDVVDDSPADEAGFEKGDLIVDIDGTSITDVDGAIAKVKDLGPGSKVKMVVMREGKKQVISAVLGDRAQMAAKIDEDDKDDEDDEAEAEDDYYNFRIPRIERVFKDIKDIRIGHGGYIGVEIRTISADLGAYFGVAGGEGLLVLEVVEESPAEMAGLRAGDVIVKVDGQDTQCPEMFAAYVREHEAGDKLDITFKRHKETRRVTVEVGESPDAARMFLNQMGEPDPMTWMGKGPEGCGSRCIDLGDGRCIIRLDPGHKCSVMCSPDCKMKMKGCCEKMKECHGKMIECHEKAMKAGEKAIDCYEKQMEAGEKAEQMEIEIKCHRMMDESVMEPGKCKEGAGGGEMKVIKKRGGEDLQVEMEHLKQEMERLKAELEALKKE